MRAFRMGCYASLLVGILPACWVEAQGRRPKTEKLRTITTIKDMRPGLLLLVTGTGEEWLVQAPLNPQQIRVTGTAKLDWLRRGMLVRFTGEFDSRGRALKPISEVTVFTPRAGLQVGVMPASQLPDLPTEPTVGKKKPIRPISGEFLVAGKLVSIRDRQVTVAVGRSSVKAELAPEVKIKVDVNDYSIAGAGDKVELEAEYQRQFKGRALATRLTINVSRELTTKPEGKPRGNKKK